MDFLHVWVLGIVSPHRSFEELKSKPAPMWGFWAVVIRFVFTSLTTILLLYLLDRVPFKPSRLTFIATEAYYGMEIFFLPVYGLLIWLAGSSIVHLVLRLSDSACNFDRILNVVGMGMLIPMPLVWVWDWTMIALDSYHITVMAVSHSLFALWGIVLFSIGFIKILELRVLPAVGFAIVITGTYISMAMIFIR